ncbi:6-bladed beta-propeller [Candidatus Zixiibacteriota bacterium]
MSRNTESPAQSISLLVMVFFSFILIGTGIASAQDVPVIENGSRGSMRNAPELTEEAVAGLDGPEEAMFYRPMNAFFGPDGNLYIADAGQHAILVYDRDGGFVRKIGQEGEGPGEIKMPATSYISPAGELIIEDPANGRRSFFSLEGEFLKSEPLGMSFSSGNPLVMEDGELARPALGAVIMRSGPGGGDQAADETPPLLEIVDPDGEVRLKVGEQKSHENQVLGMLINRSSMAYAPGGHLVVAFGILNEIHVYETATGRLERIITRRLAFSPKEPDMTMQRESTTDPVSGAQSVRMTVAPDVDPITDSIAVDREGRIWTLTRLTSQEETDDKETEGEYEGLTHIEIFSLEGDLLVTIPLDVPSTMIRFDAEGDLWLVDTRATMAAYRYSVSW